MFRLRPSALYLIRNSTSSGSNNTVMEQTANVILYGPGLSSGVVGASNYFEIDMDTVSDYCNPVTITVDGPSRAEVSQKFGFHIMQVIYRVEEPGVYLLSVQYSDQHVTGSPFQVNVSKVQERYSNPKAVLAQGKGLEKLTQGVAGNFKINARSAGEGFLQISVDGPSKVFITCLEVKDSKIYNVSYTPFNAGYYFTQVKFNGRHITGSPFRAECRSAGKSVSDSKFNSGIGLGLSLPELPLPEKNSRRRRWVFV